MTRAVANSAFQPSKMIPPTQNKKNFQNPMRETCKLGIMAKLAFACQKSIPATLSNKAERTLAGPSASVSRLNNFLLIRLFLVSLMGFQKFFLFWVGGIILKGWEAELETALVIGN